MHPTPHNWTEARRLQAWHLKQQGWSQRRMAEALVVSEGPVRQGMARARNASPEALQRRLPPGAPRRLSPEPLARLPELWHRGPTAYSFRGELWTRSRVAAIICLAFGVTYQPRPVGCILDAPRWSPQNPARHARQRNEAAIAQQRDETWPAIKTGHRSSSKRFSS